MSYERLGLLSDVEPVLHMHGYSTSECAVMFAIANAENSKLTKEIDAGNLDPYSRDGLDAWCRAGAASIAYTKGLTERFVFSALQRMELDGLIEVRRRTKTRGGVERRSFVWPDWRRLNLPAFKVLERALPDAKRELDVFLDGAKRVVTPLDFEPLLKPEDASPELKEGALLVAEGADDLTDGHRTVCGFSSRYDRDLYLVYLRSILDSEDWSIHPCMGEDTHGRIAPGIWLRRRGSVADSLPDRFKEIEPWVIDYIDEGLFEILSEKQDGYQFTKRYYRDRALEYLGWKLHPAQWNCTPVDAVDSEGVIRPSIKTSPVQDELTACAG